MTRLRSNFAELGATPTLVASTDFIYDDAEHMVKLVSVVQRAYVLATELTSYAVTELRSYEFTQVAALRS